MDQSAKDPRQAEAPSITHNLNALRRNAKISVPTSQKWSCTAQPRSASKYLFDLGVSYKEAPQCVAGVHFGALQRHHDVAVLLAVLRRPVLVTFPLGGAGTGEENQSPVRRSFSTLCESKEPKGNLLCLSPPGW